MWLTWWATTKSFNETEFGINPLLICATARDRHLKRSLVGSAYLVFRIRFGGKIQPATTLAYFKLKQIVSQPFSLIRLADKGAGVNSFEKCRDWIVHSYLRDIDLNGYDLSLICHKAFYICKIWLHVQGIQFRFLNLDFRESFM